MNIVVVLVLLALGLFSSTGSEVEVTPAPSDEAFPRGLGPLRGDDAIEDRFLTRTPIAACDVVTISGTAALDPVAFTCLEDAIEADEGAELIVAGDPSGDAQVFVYYRYNPGGPLEVFADLRADGRGRDWGYQRCRPSENLADDHCA